MSRLTDPLRLQKEIDAQKKRAEGEYIGHLIQYHDRDFVSFKPKSLVV